MEQFVILIIIASISVVNWVLKRLAEQREATKLAQAKQPDEVEIRQKSRRKLKPHPLEEAARRGIEHLQEDPTFRELAEALGLPPAAARPQKVRKPASSPPTISEEFISLEKNAPRQRAIRPRQEIHLADAGAQSKVASEKSVGDIRRMLAGRDAKKRAIILAEVLGQPRGLLDYSEGLKSGVN